MTFTLDCGTIETDPVRNDSIHSMLQAGRRVPGLKNK